jgi:hypothetical protein
MTAPLLVLIPLSLLAIVLLFSFVGCGLDTSGLGNPAYTQYTTNTILPTAGLIAYWPLSEPAGATTAVDLKGGRNGTYVTAPAYPSDPTHNSAAAPGTYQLAQPGIVPGDTVQPGNDPDVRTTCLEVNGGYVSVPFNAALNPTKAQGFTLEAWVRVDWAATDPAAYRCVIASRDASSGDKGFALFATPDNLWEIWVGNGGGGPKGWTMATGEAVSFGTTSYLAVTYDGTTLTLYVDGQVSLSGVKPPDPSRKNPQPASYAPTSKNALYIGTGEPELPLRPQAPGVEAGPLHPFVGEVQDVALYKGALDPINDILKHYHNGNGIDP